MTTAELLAEQFAGTRAWTLALLADFEGDDWIFQPGAGLASGLWTLGHLVMAENAVIHMRCFGRSIVDADFLAPFNRGQTVAPASAGGYPPHEQVLETFHNVHAQTLDAIRSMSDADLALPADGVNMPPHPAFTDRRGAAIHISRHEAYHAGQLGLIRRLRGKNYLR